MYICKDKINTKMKKIVFVLFATIALGGYPVASQANAAIEIIDNDYQNVAISVNASTLHVTGANGQVMHIYNVAGVRVMSVKIEGNDRKMDLNLPKGCYIVKVGKTVRKISIK